MAEQKIGKYRILERIGQGGMGMIFKAHDPLLDRLVALKVISPEIEITDEMRIRFFREAQACARLSHPNIVTVYDLGEDGGRLYIAMELLQGQELRRFIKPPDTLTLDEKLSIMVQACRGLHYAHQKGIVHRDIKPGNIFLPHNGPVKILDFGLALMADAQDTDTGLIIGTLRYLPPEQVRGHADYRSDMFSLAAVFYELLALRPPFTGEDPMQVLEQIQSETPPALHEVDPRIPPALDAIVQRAMRKDPAQRFHDLDEMRVEIEKVQRTIAEERERPTTQATEPPLAQEPLPTEAPERGEARLGRATPQQQALTLLARATELFRERDVDRAAALVKDALELDPDLPEAHVLKHEIEVHVASRLDARRAHGGDPGSTAGRPQIGRFQLIDIVGRGSTGPVHRAWDPDYERIVALKVVDDSRLDRTRFRRATLAWMRLERHPNVVQVYEPCGHDDRPYIAMEYLEGSDLRTLIEPRPKIALRDKLSLIVQVCEGLCHLHRQGIIHRDIRPSSIFVLRDNSVKLLESGMARQALPNDLDMTSTQFILDDYRAPEQARGRSEFRSDVFSVGKVLFELLTYHRLPASAAADTVQEQLQGTDPALPQRVVQTIQRAVRPLPAERFDIDEMREELRDILRTLPYTSPNRGRVLFALHGIRTHAAWQKALMEVAHMQQWNCRTFLWSYGYVSLLQFLLPWQRTRKIERFRDTYDLEVRNKDVNLTQGQLPSIVAHSFGTYILGQALLAYRHIRFDKVILCGSILPCDFPWDHLIARGQVKAIRNEYGQKDAWPGIVPWFVNDTGPSGRAGFATPCHPDRLEQEEFFVSHSAYFDKGHVEDAWFPFLNRTVPERLAATPVSTVRRSTNRPVALYLLIVLLAAAAVLSGLKLYWLLTSLL